MPNIDTGTGSTAEISYQPEISSSEDLEVVDSRDDFRRQFRVITGTEKTPKTSPRSKLLTGQSQDDEIEKSLPEYRMVSSLPASIYEENLRVLPSTKSTRPPESDTTAIRIQRAHFVRQILTDLRHIQRHCGTTRSARYADSLLRTMRTMCDLLPADPYIEVVMALHDALAYKNNWLHYNADQYEGACNVLKKSIRHVTTRRVEKAILELDQLGFDTIPFELESVFEPEVQDAE